MTHPSTPKRSPVPFVAADGVDCLRVPLAGNRGEAVIEAADMERLCQAGVTPNFSFNRATDERYRYVRARIADGNTVTAARFIAAAGRGQYVRYHDGNPLNLRRGNLYLTEGHAKMDCAALIEQAKADPNSSAEISARVSDTGAGTRSPRGAAWAYHGETEGCSRVDA